MKILIITNSSNGLYSFRKELINELIRKKHNVSIVTRISGREDELKNLQCKLINISMGRRSINPLMDLKLIIQYRKIFNEVKPDMVITYTIKPNIYGSLIARINKVEYAVNITGLGTIFQNESILKKMVVFLYRISLKKAKIVFFENIQNKQVFVDEKIVIEKNACCLNGAGVNLEQYSFTPYPSENETIRFLFIGRIMKEKGIEEYLYAAKMIRKQYPNVHFDIVGPMEDHYQDIIDEYKTKNVINYYGYQEDVRPFITRCHCFVLPSYHEGMANTLLEAAAMGRPLITSDIHGCKEAVVENISGFLVDKKNKESLYGIVEKFIHLPYTEKKEMGLTSKKYVELYFDKNKIVEKTIEELKL